jgi:hypothetical protein
VFCGTWICLLIWDLCCKPVVDNIYIKRYNERNPPSGVISGALQRIGPN